MYYSFEYNIFIIYGIRAIYTSIDMEYITIILVIFPKDDFLAIGEW